MTPLLFYRIAAGLFALFAAGHTLGFTSTTRMPPEAMAVRQSMESVRFPFGGADCTWLGFYLGFGFFVTTYLLFSAIMAWQLGNLARTRPQELRILAWTFFACQIAIAFLSWRFFFLPPVVFSVLIALCLGIAAWQLG